MDALSTKKRLQCDEYNDRFQYLLAKSLYRELEIPYFSEGEVKRLQELKIAPHNAIEYVTAGFHTANDMINIRGTPTGISGRSATYYSSHPYFYGNADRMIKAAERGLRGTFVHRCTKRDPDIIYDQLKSLCDLGFSASIYEKFLDVLESTNNVISVCGAGVRTLEDLNYIRTFTKRVPFIATIARRLKDANLPYKRIAGISPKSAAARVSPDSTIRALLLTEGTGKIPNDFGPKATANDIELFLRWKTEDAKYYLEVVGSAEEAKPLIDEGISGLLAIEYKKLNLTLREMILAHSKRGKLSLNQIRTAMRTLGARDKGGLEDKINIERVFSYYGIPYRTPPAPVIITPKVFKRTMPIPKPPPLIQPRREVPTEKTVMAKLHRIISELSNEEVPILEVIPLSDDD